MLILILTPPRPHKQRWGHLLQRASAPPAAPTRAAATGRSNCDRTSTRSLWVGWRAGRVQRSSESEWTAGWHRFCSHMMTQHQEKHKQDNVMQIKWGFYWYVLFCFKVISLCWLDFSKWLINISVKIKDLWEMSHRCWENTQWYLKHNKPSFWSWNHYKRCRLIMWVQSVILLPSGMQ